MCTVSSLYEVTFRAAVSAVSVCLVVPAVLLFMAKLKLASKFNDDGDNEHTIQWSDIRHKVSSPYYIPIVNKKVKSWLRLANG